MMHRRLILLVFLCLIPAARPVTAGDCPGFEAWDNKTFAHVADHLAADGSSLWVGTQGGGVLHWDLNTGTYEKHTRVGNCLADLFINDLAVDPTTGTVWAATNRGLSELPGDGSTAGLWNFYDSTNSDLGSDLITAVAAEPSGVVWVGTYDAGLYRIENGVWTRFDPANSGLSDIFVTRIVVDRQNRKWIGVWGDGVDVFDDATWVNHDPSNTWPTPQTCNETCSNILTCPPDSIGLISFFADPLGVGPGPEEVWIRNVDDGLCALNGVTQHSADAWRTFTEQNSDLPSNFVDEAATDSSGVVWVASQNGAAGYDGSRWTHVPDLRGRAVLNHEGDMWFGTAQGAVHYDGVVRDQLVPGELQGERAYDFALDPFEGSAWIANNQGLHFYDGSTWTVLDETNSPLPSDDIRALHFDQDVNLWVGMQLGGVARFDGTDWTVWGPADGLNCTNVTSLANDADGNIWAAYKFGGVCLYDGVSWQPPPPGLPSTAVQDMALAPDGHLWFATPQGAVRYDGVSYTTYTTADGLPHNSVRSVYAHPNGEVWIGTIQGVVRYDGANFTTYDVGDNTIVTIAADVSGNVWVGARDGGIGIWNGTDWSFLTYDDGLIFSRVLSIAGGVDERVWIGTEMGFSIYGQPGPPGDVPDGTDVLEPPLRVAKPAIDPSRIRITWADSCAASNPDYAVYEGTLGDFTSHLSETCSTSRQTRWEMTPAEGSRYYLVTAHNSEVEGSYGRNSDGIERPASPGPCVPVLEPGTCN